MLQIVENTDEMIMREVPYAHWLGSFFISATSLFFLYYSLSTATDSFNLAWIIAISVSGVIFFFSLITNPAITIKINKQKRTISIRKQSLLKYSFNIYDFDEVADLIYIDEKNEARDNKSHRIILPLNDGSKIELSAPIGAKQSQYFNAAQLMNSYIFDSPNKIPFTFAVFVDD